MKGSRNMGVSQLLAKLRSRGGDKNNARSEFDKLSAVLEELDQGVALYSRLGELEYANAIAKHLHFPEGEQLRHRVYGSSQKNIKFTGAHRQALNAGKVDLDDDGFALLSNDTLHHAAQLKKLSSYLANDSVNANPFALVARALGLTSRWRWVSVTWFLDQPDHKSELRGFWDRVSLVDMPGLDVQCPHKLPMSGDAVFFGSVDSATEHSSGSPFADAEIRAFAGLVYSVNGAPQGEVYLLDSDPHADRRTMGAMLAMVAGYLDVKLQLVQPHFKSSIHQSLDLTDSLTQFGNKYALNKHRHLLSTAYLKGDLADVLVVDIELRRSSNWQQSGDSASIVACAEVMRLAWPSAGCLFRPDDDRFVILIPGICAKEHVGLVQLMDDAIARLAECDVCRHELAYGLSFLSRNNGKLAQTEQVAAEHRQTMYFEQVAQ